MSSVDPRWSPPPEYRPHPASRVFAIVLPVVLLFVLALPLGIAVAVRELRSPAPSSSAPVPSASATEGGAGVGDPYFPDYGSSGYDAQRYQISVSFDPGSQTLTGTTTITARASQQLSSFYVDLALDVTAVTVDGEPAADAKEGFQDVKITPAKPVAAGAEFEVRIDYGGRPGDVTRGRNTAYWATGQEWMISGEPESAAWWFPSNDHPSDPALMDVSVRVPVGLQAVSVGRLASRDTENEADFDTWHWVAGQPMATYLNFVAIGKFDLATGAVDGRPYVYAVSQQLPEDRRQAAMTALKTSDAVVAQLERAFGPYPFTELGGIVPAHPLWFDGLETQTRPIYKATSIVDPEYAPELIAHELAHMWFGDHVTLLQWNDIFINEAYASYAQWRYTEQTGGRPASGRLNSAYERTRDNAAFWQVTMIDPGPAQLFRTVYARGPMALQALRNVMGADAFDTFTRAWAADAGARSLEQWMIKAQASTTVDLVPFFQAWIFSPTVPARTAANGFR